MKFILIFLVVFGHFLSDYMKEFVVARQMTFFIYTFHMPLFIFISGLFSKKIVNEKKLNYRKVTPYFVLYVFMKALFFSFNMLIGRTGARFTLLSENGVPWFVFALAVWYMITFAIKNCNKKYCLVVSVCLGCFIGYDATISDFLVISRIIIFYPFFLLGYYVDIYELALKTRNWSIRLISILVLLVFSYVCFYEFDKISWFMSTLSARNPYIKFSKMSELGAIVRFGYYLVVPIISIAIISLTPNRKLFITSYGRKTISVYVFHYLVVFVFQKNDWLKMISQKYPDSWITIIIIISLLTTVVTTLPIFGNIVNAVLGVYSKENYKKEKVATNIIVEMESA